MNQEEKPEQTKKFQNWISNKKLSNQKKKKNSLDQTEDVFTTDFYQTYNDYSTETIPILLNYSTE